MSYKNLKLTIWSKKEGEVRVYIGTAYVDHRNGMSYADGCWIAKSEDGIAVFKYKATHSSNFAEDRMLSLKMVRSYLMGHNPELDSSNDLKLGIAFDELLGRIEKCKTAQGNFSYNKYEKKFG